jgi:DNA repair photolyase
MKVHKCSSRQILQPCSLEMFGYQVDPYIGCEHHCHYCYTLNNAEIDPTKEILMHQDIVGQLNQELSKLEPQTIYLGMNTDPYQPSERTYQQTRQVLELLAQQGFSVCILTKSDLIVRDIDLLTSMSGSSAGISIAFQDENARRLFELKAPPNKERIKALKKLKDAGIETYTLITPVMPFISDVELLIEMVVPYADTIWLYGLSMEAEEDRNWQNVQRILDCHFPELTQKYKQIAFSVDHLYWVDLRQKLKKIQKQRQLNLRIEL